MLSVCSSTSPNSVAVTVLAGAMLAYDTLLTARTSSLAAKPSIASAATRPPQCHGTSYQRIFSEPCNRALSHLQQMRFEQLQLQQTLHERIYPDILLRSEKVVSQNTNAPSTNTRTGSDKNQRLPI